MSRKIFCFMIVVALFLACLASCSPASDNDSGNGNQDSNKIGTLGYKLSDDEKSYVVTSIGTYKGPDVLIPVEYNGKPVVAIDDSAFFKCTGIETVDFEGDSNVAKIGEYAFSGCVNLKSIKIPNSVTYIGKSAFGNGAVIVGGNSILADACTSLESVLFGESCRISSFEYALFSGCTALKEIEIPRSVGQINEKVFLGCDNLQTVIYRGTLEEWNNIPKGRQWILNTDSCTIRCTDGDAQ